MVRIFTAGTALIYLSVLAPAVTSATVAVGVRPAAPRVVRFVERAQVSGRYGTYSPWSPTAPLFAYVDRRGIYVLNVEKHECVAK